MVEFSNSPKGWLLTNLESISEIILGQSPPSSTYNENGEGLPFYQGKLEFGEIYPIPQKWCSSPKKIAEKGDVLISVRAPVGPTNVCPGKSCIGRGLAAIRGIGGISPFFILYLIRTIENAIAGKGTGTTFNAITGGQLRSIEVPLPPLPEQHHIVAKIEELFTKLDAGVEALKKVKAQLKRYRQAVLKYAFEGKLTQEWREANKDKLEPASVLLERIKEEREKKVGGKFKELPPLDTSDLPELPEGWIWTRLGQIISVKSGDGLPSHRMEIGGKYPVYGGNGITGYHSEHMFEEKKLIIGRVGAKCGVVHITQPKSWVTDNALVVDFKNLYVEYLFYAIGYLDLNKYSVSTAQPVISGSKIYPLPFCLPPFDEQKQIIEEIEERLSIADAVEKIAEQTLKQSEKLRQSILKTAFEGKLVPQDPTDELAKKLLERIKAEKAKKELETKSKRKRSKQMELK